MSRLHNEIEKHIKKLIKPLKDEESLIPILRKRLTKKEYKLLTMLSNEWSIEEIYAKLSLDSESLPLLKNKLIKKLNQEKLKQEIMV